MVWTCTPNSFYDMVNVCIVNLSNGKSVFETRYSPLIKIVSKMLFFCTRK